MPQVRLADIVSLRSGVLLLVLSLWGGCGDNTVVGKAEQSWHRRGLRAGLCLWTQVGTWHLQVGTGVPGGSVGMHGCSHVARDGVGARGSAVFVHLGADGSGLPAGRMRALSNAPACIGAGRAAWMRLEAWQLIVGMLGVLAAPALPRAWHWALPMHRDPWRP